MTITDTSTTTRRPAVAPIPAWVAALLPAGPALMLAETLAPSTWSIFFGLLSTPFVLVTAAGAAAVCRYAAPRAAGIALAALICNVVGLAAVHGMEATAAALGNADADVTSQPAGVLLAVLFFGGNLVGGVALIWAQFRTRALPRLVPALLLASLVADIAVPDGAPAAAKSAGMALFLLWSVALAVAVRRVSR